MEVSLGCPYYCVLALDMYGGVDGEVVRWGGGAVERCHGGEGIRGVGLCGGLGEGVVVGKDARRHIRLVLNWRGGRGAESGGHYAGRIRHR